MTEKKEDTQETEVKEGDEVEAEAKTEDGEVAVDAPSEASEETELEAAEKVEAEVEEKEAESAEPEPEVEEPKEARAEAAAGASKKGLMERRKSFAQSSVPNAHRGYNPKTPVVMLGIIAVFVIVSFILAAFTA